MVGRWHGKGTGLFSLVPTWGILSLQVRVHTAHRPPSTCVQKITLAASSLLHFYTFFL